MLRNLGTALLIFAALVLQVSLLNPLLGGFAPDLVLLVVAMLAAGRGPADGAVIGFCAGVASDLLPPAHHTLGQYALVLCFLGYAAGRLGGQAPLIAMAACGVVAPGLYAGVAALIGSPGVTWDVLATAWPRAALCNALAAPAVAWALTAGQRRRRRVVRADFATSWRRGTA